MSVSITVILNCASKQYCPCKPERAREKACGFAWRFTNKPRGPYCWVSGVQLVVWENVVTASVLIFPRSLFQYHRTKDSPSRCSSYCCLSCSWKARMTWDQIASADAWSKQPHLRLCRCQPSRKPFVIEPLLFPSQVHFCQSQLGLEWKRSS